MHMLNAANIESNSHPIKWMLCVCLNDLSQVKELRRKQKEIKANLISFLFLQASKSSDSKLPIASIDIQIAVWIEFTQQKMENYDKWSEKKNSFAKCY